MSDHWDAIRDLDEKENWIERTSVLSKADHLQLLEFAKDVLNDVVNTLPIDEREELNGEFAQPQFTDEDFQYSAEQFDVDYLERIDTERTEPSELARQSLYVKFDPLVGTASPKVHRIEPSSSDNLLILDTPPAPSVRSCLSSNKGDTSIKKHVHIGNTVTFPQSPLIKTETSITPQPGPTYESVSLLDRSPGALGSPEPSQELFTDSCEAPPPSHSPASPPTDTLIKVLKYSEDDLVRMKEEVIAKAREEVRIKKEEEMAAMRKEIAALKKEAKKLQQKDSSIKMAVSTHQAAVAKWEAEIQQYRERVEAQEERESDILDHHENCLKDMNQIKERSNIIREDMNHLENIFEETHKSYLALKNTHKNWSAQVKQMEKKKAQLEQWNRQGAALVQRLKEERKIKAEEIETKLEQNRKELAAKKSLEKAKQDQLQMQVESLEKSIAQLEQEKQQLSSMCEELMKAM